jgi:hypothetical protein
MAAYGPSRRYGRCMVPAMTAAAAGSAEPGGRPFADATPAQLRAALSPEDAVTFDEHWQVLMRRATARLDLTDLHEALETWRLTAWATSATGADVYQRTVRAAEERARTGERAPGAVPWAQVAAELGLPG